MKTTRMYYNDDGIMIPGVLIERFRHKPVFVSMNPECGWNSQTISEATKKNLLSYEDVNQRGTKKNLNKEEILRELESYEVVCDNCACNDGWDCAKQIMRKAAALIRDLSEKNENLKAIPEQLHKEMTERMTEEVKVARKYTARTMRERLHVELRMYDSKDKFNKEFFLSKVDKITEELVERE